jgi:hypothetical protein
MIEKPKPKLLHWWIVPPENLAELAEIMLPVQEEAAKMSEEEINAAIDEAIVAVRRERKSRLDAAGG